MLTPQGNRPGHQRGNPAPRDVKPGGQPPAGGFDNIKFGKPLNPELFNIIAQSAARSVANTDDRNRNKSTQLRRFYDELCLWETRVSQQPDKFAEYLPFIRMLNAKVAYAEGRKLVDPTFVRLMYHTLGEVEDADSLGACKLFWEAFMGFYKQERAD